MKKNIDYTIESFPASRKFTMDVGRIGLNRHHIKALIEIDITGPRKIIKSRKTGSGDKISFTSWIIKCIGQAISARKEVHALKKGSDSVIIFNDIDISILVEKEVDGVPVPLPLVIRDVNRKSIHEIYNEIENAKNKIIEEGDKFVLEQNRKNRSAKIFSLIPQFIRLLIWKLILHNPHRIKRMMGTAVVTSVGMMGNADGWIIPYSIHPLCFALGSIVKKPGVVNDNIEIREYLKMTILIDHDVIDGAPAARFVSQLTDLIESGYGL
jgi:pyruvate/2-oxoglutarate dehydrogenase complex dihydrolipoamide acyltransferase (E2) component